MTREEWFSRLNAAADEYHRKRAELHEASHGTNAEAVMDGVAGVFGALGAMEREARKMKAEIRRENRRQQYALRKKQGLIKTSAQRKAEKDAKRAAEREEERRQEAWVPESCYCWQGHPPCGWCLDPQNDPDYVEDEE